MDKDVKMLEEAYGKVLQETNHDILSPQQIKNWIINGLPDVVKFLEEDPINIHDAWLDLREMVDNLQYHVENTPSEKYQNEPENVTQLPNDDFKHSEANKENDSNIINFPRQDLP